MRSRGYPVSDEEFYPHTTAGFNSPPKNQLLGFQSMDGRRIFAVATVSLVVALLLALPMLRYTVEWNAEDSEIAKWGAMLSTLGFWKFYAQNVFWLSLAGFVSGLVTRTKIGRGKET